jgi:hypothetical protein
MEQPHVWLFHVPFWSFVSPTGAAICWRFDRASLTNFIELPLDYLVKQWQIEITRATLPMNQNTIISISFYLTKQAQWSFQSSFPVFLPIQSNHNNRPTLTFIFSIFFLDPNEVCACTVELFVWKAIWYELLTAKSYSCNESTKCLPVLHIYLP